MVNIYAIAAKSEKRVFYLFTYLITKCRIDIVSKLKKLISKHHYSVYTIYVEINNVMYSLYVSRSVLYYIYFTNAIAFSARYTARCQLISWSCRSCEHNSRILSYNSLIQLAFWYIIMHLYFAVV